MRDVVERVTRKNKNTESSLPLTISAQHGLIDQITFFNKQVASRDLSNYFLLENGEFAYNKSYSNDYPWGAVKRLDKYEQGVLSTLYIVFKPTKVNSNFLVSYYDTNRWHKEVSDRAAEGARNHGLLNISASDFFDTELKVPVEKNEQEQIGEFFKQLDKKVALHQRELTTLKQTKQGFLQKMFPKEGESVPEVRFSGFTGDWEQRKLNTVFKDFIVPMRDKPKEFSGTIPWTRIEDIEGRYINGTTSGQYVSKETIKSMNLKIIPKGSLIVSASATFGVVAIVNNDLITNQTFIGLVPNNNFNVDYLFAFFKSTNIQKKMKRESAGSTIFYISRKQFEEMTGEFPILEEQEKIGNFFKELDVIIALHEHELDALKEMKKAFLQKMFV
nr:restriction endonuclease subunit S [Fictibacillus barbaricus]